MEISKSAVLLANEHQSDRKKCYNDFHIKITMYSTLAMECQNM